MTFDEVLAQVRELLQREQRVSYRGLKRRFALDDEYLEDLKEELIGAKRLATDEDGRFLVWAGAAPVLSSESRVLIPSQPPAPNTQPPAERRQLTVMFCDLVGSTALSSRLDPEELREVVRRYQDICAATIRRYDGYIAQHLGDGLLAYFGYPTAHEDDAAHAVRAGLEIVAALQQSSSRHDVPSPFQGEGQGEGRVTTQSSSPHPHLLPGGEKEFRSLRVRIGIHTGLVVIGEIGSSEKREVLALGETPNLAARIQGQAQPDEVMVSAATYRLIEGMFVAEERGQPELKGVASPQTLYRVVKESEAHSRFEVVVRQGLTPLVGREHELGLLRERWSRAKDGSGQVVLLSGEPGIGKSRLVEALKEHVGHEGARFLELRCSPYAQNSALAPVIEHLQRALELRPEDSAEEKLRKLERDLEGRGEVTSPLRGEMIVLFAGLLALPHPDGYPPLTFSPQKQKEKTYEALVTWLSAEAEQRAVVYAWEDLHWADPSTLELLTLFLQQVPARQLLSVLTFRPEFLPLWGVHSYLSQLSLGRLGRNQVETMVESVIGGKALSVDVVQQIVNKTDGVPLFVEELTKAVAETVGAHSSAPLHLGIPATLQDALMARLDRLGTAKDLAQLGATLGREFSYELLHAVSPLPGASLQHELKQLVASELVYQSGLPPQARYLFKHALVRDTAYQSLLKGRRQHLHQQVAQVLVERFPDTVETQPELVAHHYTEANLIEQAIPYWQRAGERAIQRSAYVEAINHLNKGLEVLKTLPDTPERARQELALLITLGTPLITTKGYTVPEVEKTYARALELCQQIGETPHLFPVLGGLMAFYQARGDLQMARKLGEQGVRLAQNGQNPSFLLEAYHALGVALFWLGEFVPARVHLEQSMHLSDAQLYASRPFLAPQEPQMHCLSYAAWVSWFLGYPDQASEKIAEALNLARELSRSYSQAWVLIPAAEIHQHRREAQLTLECAEAAVALANDLRFPPVLAMGTIMRGWALAEQGQGEQGIEQIRQGCTAWQTMGGDIQRPYSLALLAEAHVKMGRIEEGLAVLAEALDMAKTIGTYWWEAELYRLRGELLLIKAREQETRSGQRERVTDP